MGPAAHDDMWDKVRDGYCNCVRMIASSRMAPSLAVVAYNARAVTKASCIGQLVCPSKDLLKDERRMKHRLMKYPSSAFMDAT
eukprot:4234892-Karenia_brevis.AAC.1